MGCAQPDCSSDGLVPGRVAGEYPFNRIQSHPADHGTGGGRKGDNGKKARYGRMQGEEMERAVYLGDGCNLKRAKWWSVVIIITIMFMLL